MIVEKRTKEFVTKQDYTVYIANDGTEFKTEEECQKYNDGATCAYKTLLSKVMKPIKGSFKYSDTQNHPELVNVYKNVVDDIFEDGRRECEYYTFKPQSEEDIKNFIALLKVQNASVRGCSWYENIDNPYTQLDKLKTGCDYIIINYADTAFYQIIEAKQFSEVIRDIIEKAIENVFNMTKEQKLKFADYILN